MGYIADIDKTQATLGQMVIYVNALGAVTQYELLQGEDVISSNTDGKFLLDIIQKNGETEYLNWITTDLVNNKPVYVRITGRDGEQVTEKLGINISRSCVSLTDVEQKWTTSFGKKFILNFSHSNPQAN